MAWTEEVKHAKSGDYEVNLYDDNGYSAMKRVLERGDDPSSVKPLVTIMVNHPVSAKAGREIAPATADLSNTVWKTRKLLSVKKFVKIYLY